MTDDTHDPRANIDALLATIRESAGQIQADIDAIDAEATDDELNDLWKWCDKTSAETYRWSDE